jgi:hypothetical protein
MGKKTFFFPDSLSNERVGNDNQKCIFIGANGKRLFILTGQSVELTQQEYSILRDSGLITDNYKYTEVEEFDPLKI